jgi:hypothetical protein
MGSSESTCGFRIILVSHKSPASEAGLVSYLDFIISANGVPLSPDKTLNTIISKSLNCRVTLKVFNILSGLVREVQVLPSNSWGGDGLLGATVRWENWKTAEGLRILEVTPESYAHQLGLRPREDYILGTETCSINDVQTFEEILNSEKSFMLFVLNSGNGKVRNISVKPGNRLGCTVGEGMMNSVQSIEVKNEEVACEEEVKITVLGKKMENGEKENQQKIEIQKKKIKEEDIAPPPPPPVRPKEKPKINGIVSVLPPPSIYDLSMESLTFQPKVLMSKYVQIS